MYGNGILGNHAILNTLGSLTNGVFNYIRPNNSPPYALKSILGDAYAYMYPDADVEPSDALKMFISRAKGFNANNFKKD